MIKLLIILLIPISAFAKETDKLVLNPAGMFFMIFSWSAIIIWNAVCFTKLISKKK